MSITLNKLANNKGARKNRTIVGRGIGSGKGKTCGHGQKGQKSRSGVAIKGFEGGQMPIYRRLPKRGFTSPNRKEVQKVNISVLQDFIEAKKLDASKPIDQNILAEAGLVRTAKTAVKLLATGELKSKITIQVDAASKSAIAAVEKAGGKVNISPLPVKKSVQADKKPASKSKKPAQKKEKEANAA